MRKRNRYLPPEPGVLDGTARLNITWAAQNGDLPDPIPYDVSDATIKALATEAVRAGSVPGIRADRAASFQHFVVDRYPVTKEVPYSRFFLRPKTPFGDR